ncbi:MAG: glycosyltransferase family 39 protein [Prevotellaceae bacterium]|jgi:tetratricopeptide (TPR) repeat protein|nr:glycosyltransferase family 39 protein [Prevotellaceae bacterium]
MKTTGKQMSPKPAPKPVVECVDSPFWNRYKYVFLAAIVVVTAALYFPSSLENNFTRYWDDETIVVQNEDIRSLSWEHLGNMFTRSYYDMYCPVKILSHTLDYQLFELNPAGYHLTSLLYHLINILLLFTLIRVMLKSTPAALLAALAYALHPTAVETVSWVTGRGDLLYALFAFPALTYYVKYLTQGRKRKYFLFTFLFFVLSGLSKPTAMTLPVTLFVFDWYYKRKVFSKEVILEKVPFLAISVVLGILSIALRGSGAPEISGFLEFFKSYKGYLFITYPLAFYMVKFVFPLPLSFIYPHVSYYFYNRLMLPALVWLSPFILLAALIVIFKAKTMRRPLVFGGLFYFTTIFSTLQIIPIVAVSAHDRYFYVPIFGFLFFTAWLYTYFKQENRMKALRIYVTAILAVSAAFAYISFDRAKIWKSTVTLFEDVIKKQPRFIEGYDKMSEHYFIVAYNRSAAGDYENAAGDFRNAIAWAKVTLKKRDNYPGEYLRLVKCHLALNEPDSAMIYAPYAVKSAGNMQQMLEACGLKGYLDMRAGRYADAVADYDMLLKYNPNAVNDLFQRAVAKMSMQQYEPALADFGRVLQLQPNEANAHVNVGRIYANMNRVELAMEHINRALQINPEHPDAYFMRGTFYFQMGQRAAAKADFNKANSLGYPEAAAWLDRLK